MSDVASNTSSPCACCPVWNSLQLRTAATGFGPDIPPPRTMSGPALAGWGRLAWSLPVLRGSGDFPLPPKKVRHNTTATPKISQNTPQTPQSPSTHPETPVFTSKVFPGGLVVLGHFG